MTSSRKGLQTWAQNISFSTTWFFLPVLSGNQTFPAPSPCLSVDCPGTRLLLKPEERGSRQTHREGWRSRWKHRNQRKYLKLSLNWGFVKFILTFNIGILLNNSWALYRETMVGKRISWILGKWIFSCENLNKFPLGFVY